MIRNDSFELFDKLVKEDNYKNLFDVSIIYQVNETINCFSKVAIPYPAKCILIQ